MSIDAVAEARQVLQQVDLFNKKAKARCRKHHCECLLYTFLEESAYIAMCWAGLTCLDVTVFGDALGIAGPRLCLSSSLCAGAFVFKRS